MNATGRGKRRSPSRSGDLSERLERGVYRAKAVRRVYIARAGRRQRPLGVPVLEDKLVQPAAVMVWHTIYQTDVIVGLQHKSEAERFPADLKARFRKRHVELHPNKTRLLEFGPFAAGNRRRRGRGKPQTFNFLGFTHVCGKKRSNGRSTVLRQTMRSRLQAKLNAVQAELRRRWHDPIPAAGQRLGRVVG